jgi:hypothetical protein
MLLKTLTLTLTEHPGSAAKFHCSIVEVWICYACAVPVLPVSFLFTGLPSALHAARASGFSSQDPLLTLQLTPGVNQTAHHAEAACCRQLSSEKVIVYT